MRPFVADPLIDFLVQESLRYCQKVAAYQTKAVAAQRIGAAQVKTAAPFARGLVSRLLPRRANTLLRGPGVNKVQTSPGVFARSVSPTASTVAKPRTAVSTPMSSTANTVAGTPAAMGPYRAAPPPSGKTPLPTPPPPMQNPPVPAAPPKPLVTNEELAAAQQRGRDRAAQNAGYADSASSPQSVADAQNMAAAKAPKRKGWSPWGTAAVVSSLGLPLLGGAALLGTQALTQRPPGSYQFGGGAPAPWMSPQQM